MTSFNDATAASSPITFMTLDDARSIVSGAVLRLPTNTINNTRLDHAIRDAGDEFTRKVQPLRRSGNASTTAESDSVAFVGDGFLPRYLVRAEIVDGDDVVRTLERTDLRTVQKKLEDQDEGLPTMIAARENGSTFRLYPIPDDVYTLQFVWAPPFVDWTAGTAQAGDVELNIPRDMIHGVLNYGVPAYFERGTEHARFVRDARRQFDLHIMHCMGLVDAESMGGHVTVNEDAY